MFKLRDYQDDSVNHTVAHINKSLASALIVLPTGAGKSLVVSELARRIHHASKGKRVLCLAPSAELVQQNREKFETYGLKASMFSASAGRKDLRHPVVFGSPLTVAKSLDQFGDYAAVIVDEAHGITPTLMEIMDTLAERNPKLRRIGMTATPFRLGQGYIYKSHVDGREINGYNSRDPYWDHVTIEVKATTLIDRGFLTRPELALPSESYSVSKLVQQGHGYTAESIDGVFNTDGDKTARIVDNVLGYFYGGGYKGCMFFAANREHAQYIASLLPPGSWRAVFANTPKAERVQTIADFKARRFPFLVNMNVLTTGFDAPHVDLIAIMRATESPGLWQQIAGRGLRLFPGKTHCKILDYADNVPRFFGDSGNIFEPEILATKPSKGVYTVCECPQCGAENTVRLNPDAVMVPNRGKLSDIADKPEIIAKIVDRYGYALDLAGERIQYQIEVTNKDHTGDVTTSTKDVDMPAHYSRRCVGMHPTGPLKELERCTFMWESKECPNCGAVNDISARCCPKCNTKFVDPNKKLHEQAAQQDVSGPYDIKEANVTGQRAKTSYTARGDVCVIVVYETDHPLAKYREISDVYMPPAKMSSTPANEKWMNLCKKAFNSVVALDTLAVVAGMREAKPPARIAFQLKKGDKYPRILRKVWSE